DDGPQDQAAQNPVAQGQGIRRYRATAALAGVGSSQQPAEIVERYFADGRQAVRALRQGDVAAVDRVNPWEVSGLKRVYHVNVAAYSVPTVHVLVPNFNRPLMRHRA